MTHPALTPRPMTTAEILDLVARTRAAMTVQSRGKVDADRRRREAGSFAEVQAIYQAARRAVPYTASRSADIFGRQPWLRKVQAEFDRRLREAGIRVEGLS